MENFDILKHQSVLEGGAMTAVNMADYYLRRIGSYNNRLNAVGEINPDLQDLAALSDIVRKKDGKRSNLEGILFVVKDNINTADKMHTTAGSSALADLYAPYDATIVSRLRKAGAIILGKANLSEFAYFMSDYRMPSGYSGLRGQVKNPYDERIDPLGSSTGSAVAVAAGLVPAAIGTETNGSIMAPSQQNSIVGVKPTVGLLSRHGIIPISFNQDTPGPMAKSVRDCAVILDALWGRDDADAATFLNPKTSYDFLGSLAMPLDKRRVGIVRFINTAYDVEEERILSEVRSRMDPFGLETVDINIHPRRIENYRTLLYEFKVAINYYLATVRGATNMKNLADIVAFNRRSPLRRMAHGQTILEAALKTSGTLNESEYISARAEIRELAGEADRLLDEYRLDALITPRRTDWAPISGNPCVSVPAKALNDLVPRSLFFTGRKWDDEILLAISHAYEKATRYRIPPVL